ncbi:MAG: Na/Pi cotransporter family protein [Bacillota bacterium]
MSITTVFYLFGGLGLFIYGMQQMGDGLQKAAGNKLKHFLGVLTVNPLVGVLVGTVVTSIIQSSSATTVMVVGFVNAGLMSLSQSIGVIMGANIGTTITAQLVAFKLGDYAFHAIAIGFFTYFFAKKQNTKYIGQVLLGFGILFLGLNTMSETMRPLKDSPMFIHWMEQFGHYPILGVMIGILVTVLVQSSSASFGILLGLFSVGAISYQAAIPIILGSNIGTTVTAVLSAIGAKISAKRTAAAHFVFNVIGAAVVIILLYLIPDFGEVMKGILSNIAGVFGVQLTETRLLANTHTFFNVLNTLIWLPFVGLIVYIVKKIIPGEDERIVRGLSHLDQRMLETPTVAVNQLNNEINRMFKIVQQMVDDVNYLILENDLKSIEEIQEKEEIIDELEEELLVFMTKIPQAKLSTADIERIDMYFAVVDAIESIGDDASEVAELMGQKLENEVDFTADADESLEDSLQLINKLMDSTQKLIAEEDQSLIPDILAGEQEMDKLELKYRNEHLERLNADSCIPSAGIIYLEILDSIENISDQTADIAYGFVDKGKEFEINVAVEPDTE